MCTLLIYNTLINNSHFLTGLLTTLLTSSDIQNLFQNIKKSEYMWKFIHHALLLFKRKPIDVIYWDFMEGQGSVRKYGSLTLKFVVSEWKRIYSEFHFLPGIFGNRKHFNENILPSFWSPIMPYKLYI